MIGIKGMIRLIAVGAVIATVWQASAYAQGAENYPNRPIKMVVPFAAGGGIDQTARIVALRMSEELGQQVVIENQGGGGGTIASSNVARSAPDGYTLIYHSVSSAVVNGVLYKNLSYDPVNGFVPVSLATRFPLVLIVNPKVAAKTLPEFIALLKKEPNKFNYGSSGVGSAIHLAAELFKSTAKVEITHVPYRGTSAAMTDLLAGNIEMLIDGVPPQIGNIEAGKVRALAVTTTTRSLALPEVPTMIEAGVQGYDIPFWTGIFAPAKTPKPIIDRLESAISKAIRHPDTQKRLRTIGTEGVGSTAAELEKFWKDQIQVYDRIVKTSGITLDKK